jgi:methoxymalonate biosynthesis acyl carrier protein
MRGYVNSLFAMQLVAFLESEFHLRIDNEDLEIENFRSVNALVRLVEKKLKPEAAAQR